jgi:hypothetical protein
VNRATSYSCDERAHKSGNPEANQITERTCCKTHYDGFQEDDPHDMGSPEADGSKDPDLSASFIDRGHHVGENDDAPNQEHNDRDPDRKSLEVIERLHPGLEGLFDRRDLGVGQLFRDLMDNLLDGAGVAEGGNFDQTQSPRFVHHSLDERQVGENEDVIL